MSAYIFPEAVISPCRPFSFEEKGRMRMECNPVLKALILAWCVLVISVGIGGVVPCKKESQG
jgi:hypothetical protein